MGGLSGIEKVGKPKNFKEVLEAGVPGSKSDVRRQKGIWNAVWKPQPSDQAVTGPKGPTMGAMSEEEAEEARRRRGSPRRPASTVLTSGADGETLGG